jgi:hypothetical protein
MSRLLRPASPSLVALVPLVLRLLCQRASLLSGALAAVMTLHFVLGEPHCDDG